MAGNNYIYIFLHPPRSGGTGLHRHIEENLLPEESLRVDYINPKSLSKKQREKIKFLVGHTAYYGIHKLFPDKNPRYMTLLRDPAELIVSLHNSRMVEFPKDKVQTFEKWYSLRKRNEMVSFFDETFRNENKKNLFFYQIKKSVRELMDKIDKSRTLHVFFKRMMKKKYSYQSEKEKFENAKKVLDLCWFVGTLNNLEKDVAFIDKKMELTKKKKFKPYKIFSKKIKKLSSLDNTRRKKIYKENQLDLELYNYANNLNKKLLTKTQTFARAI